LLIVSEIKFLEKKRKNDANRIFLVAGEEPRKFSFLKSAGVIVGSYVTVAIVAVASVVLMFGL